MPDSAELSPGPPPHRHRHLIVLRGSADATGEEAARLTGGLPPGSTLWVSERDERELFHLEPRTYATPRGARRLLGGAFDAVVIDLHRGPQPDALGACHGFVWGGGALILRLPPKEQRDLAGQERLAVPPYPPSAVGHRYRARLEAALERATVDPPRRLTPAPHRALGTADQRAAVARISALLVSEEPGVAVLLSDRGRGKSSALGLALGAALSLKPLRVAVTAPHAAAARELFRFATGSPEPPAQARGHLAPGAPRFLPPIQLARADLSFDAILIDEAAQLPVPLLRRLVMAHPEAHLVFATTTRGYEGTGRGFSLRFLPTLVDGPREVLQLALSEPIRWGVGDPLEAFAFDALLLDARLDTLSPEDVATFDPSAVVARRLDQDRLAADESLLRGVFGLLVHAHYRTTPSDLRRLLDAPNLSAHALLYKGRVIAATLVAAEGGLPAQTLDALAAGKAKLRGHALTDNLVLHLGERAAGALILRRSMRIAVHPALRRRGLATRLVAHVHASCAGASPDLFGTVFGATPGLLAFRRSVGYELVRVASSRGERAGEPSVVMLRAVTPAGRALVDRLRLELARDLPLQLELLAGGEGLPLGEDLRDALLLGLPTAPPARGEVERRAVVSSFTHGPRTFESTCVEVSRFVSEHRDALDALDPTAQALVRARVLERRSWEGAARAAGLSGPHLAMRALRPALRALAEAVDSREATTRR